MRTTSCNCSETRSHSSLVVEHSRLNKLARPLRRDPADLSIKVTKFLELISGTELEVSTVSAGLHKTLPKAMEETRPKVMDESRPRVLDESTPEALDDCEYARGESSMSV